jgi:hypothetical protein
MGQLSQYTKNRISGVKSGTNYEDKQDSQMNSNVSKSTDLHEYTKHKTSEDKVAQLHKSLKKKIPAEDLFDAALKKLNIQGPKVGVETQTETEQYIPPATKIDTEPQKDNLFTDLFRPRSSMSQDELEAISNKYEESKTVQTIDKIIGEGVSGIKRAAGAIMNLFQKKEAPAEQPQVTEQVAPEEKAGFKLGDPIEGLKNIGTSIEKGVVGIPRSLTNMNRLLTNWMREQEKYAPYAMITGKPLNLTERISPLSDEEHRKVLAIYDNAVQEIDSWVDKDKVGTASQFVGDVVGSMPKMALNFIPGVGPMLFGVSAAGDYAQQAEQQGASDNQQLLYGAIGGIGEMTLVKALQIIPGIKKIWSGEAAASGTLGKQIIKNAVSEAVEEGAIDPVMGFAEKFIYNPDKKIAGEGGIFDFGQIAYDSAAGAAMSLMFSALGLPASYQARKMAEQYVNKQQELTSSELNLLEQQYVEDIADYQQSQQAELSADSQGQQNIPIEGRVTPQKSQEEIFAEQIGRQQNAIEDLEYQRDYLGADVAANIETENQKLSDLIAQRDRFIQEKETAKAESERVYQFEQGQLPSGITIENISKEQEAPVKPVESVQPEIKPVEFQPAPAEVKTETAPVPVKKFTNAVTGKTGTAMDNEGGKISFTYKVVSADDLTASHTTSLSENPEYPQELQPRDRKRVASTVQIDSIMNNLQPEFLGENVKISDGAPIIGGDGIVESGNGRVIALKKMYETAHKNSQKYTDWLKENAETFGIDIDNLPDNPVLIRERTTDVDRVAFTKKANESSVAQMSASEMAKSDAEKMAGKTLALFVPNEDGTINTAANRQFISSFVGDVIPQNEQGKYITEEGVLSQEGLARIRNAVFYKAYGNSKMMAKLSESLDNNIRNITNAMIALAPRFVSTSEKIKNGTLHDLDFSSDLAAAAELYMKLKENGQSVEMYRNQSSLFEGDVSDIIKDILVILDKNNRSTRKITDFFNKLLDDIENFGDPSQVNIFGKTETYGKADVLDAANRRFGYGEEESQKQSSIFEHERGKGSEADGIPGSQGRGKGKEGKPEVAPNSQKGNAPASKVAQQVKQWIGENKTFTFAELTKVADEAYGGTQGQGTYSSKDAYDAMELGINQYLQDALSEESMHTDAEGAKAVLNRLREVLKQVPTQNKGNVEQQQFQQFSTPPNVAYVTAWLANIKNDDTVFEPSAGIGGLATFGKIAGAKVIVNELSEKRLDVLKNMPFDEFYNENAEQINNILHDKVKPSVIVMNPPFSATAGRMGDKNSTANAKSHLEQALKILQPGGRLVAIVGQGMSDKSPAFRDWWKEIKSEYNVRANIAVYTPDQTSRIAHTDEYKKYGTDFGVQLVVIDKTGPTKETIAENIPKLEDIIDRLEEVKNDRTTVETNRESQPDTGSEAGGRSSASTGRDTGGGRVISGTTDVVGQGERSPKGSQRQPDQMGRGDTGSAGISKPGTDGEVRQPDRRDNISERNAEIEKEAPGDGGVSIPGGRGTIAGNGSVVEAIETENIEKGEQINKVNEDAVYSEYQPQKLKIQGAQPHASPLVQSTAMASVAPPDATYTPKIPPKLITSGSLSIAQMESIVYAGMQHNKKTPDGVRKGYFIGDGTGVGKGRQIAGIILDNWNQGRRKAIWISKNGPLFKDAIRDWTALGGTERDIFEADANKPIERPNGILFSTYYTVPQGQKPNKKTGKVADLTRIDQIVNWVGKDFDGVLVFDESHMMSNLLGKKPAEMALAGVKLQEALPNARIVYASATGATEVENLAYAQRLGLWGRGTSFNDVNDFVGKIKAGGLAAMELVARDLKAMGSYIARNISFIGVKYDTRVHTLTDVQAEIYDTMADGWQIVLQNIEKYLEKTGQAKNTQAKKWVMQRFWSTQQRFFNQILTSMQMPTVIEDMKKRLAAGDACVLQLVNTNAAAEEREVSRIEEEGGSLDDMDITPKGALLEMINTSFPTQKYEEYLDDKGKKQSRPVQDSKGNPVQDADAVAAKEALMKQIDQMQIPNGPMDMILQEFGVDHVTEVTGRPRRFVFKRNRYGDMERQEESRTDKVVENDVNEFLNDKKQILIFSDAGGTGKSYHAGRDFKNQRKRVHYLIQAGWNASKAVQGFGRTHRTNQVHAPEYVLVTTNLKGQKRFISSIARRLDQLGALTKGQRQTGSSGLFSAKDNLESKEARDALELFYRHLVTGQIPGLKAKQLLQKMGLLKKILVNDVLTSDTEELRDVTRFLNRILVLKSSEQNQVFDEFMRRVDYIVEEAIRNDRLDAGLENYKSAGAAVTEDAVIHTDATGAQTKYIAITAKQKAQYWQHREITSLDDFIGFYGEKETGEVRAAIKAVDKTYADGSIARTYYMQSPTVGKRSHIVENSFKDKWVKIDKSEEKAAWEKELKNEPKFREEKLHLISGALLPIWNRLPEDHARVIRITTDDGNSYLGRLIPTHQIDETLRRLGISRTKERFGIEDSIKRVLDDDMIIRLVDRTIIKRARVAGENRLEIKGSNLWAIQRNYRDIFSEKIGSEWRYFIPTGDKAVKILEGITESAPILEVVANRGGESEVKGFSSTSQIEMPRGDASGTSSKTVDDLIAIIEEHTGVPIRTGKYRQKALGIFKVKPEVIRTKVRGNMPVISHELGHYLDKKHGFSNESTFDNELLTLGQKTSRQSYDKKQIRQEGVAEFVRLYLTDPDKVNSLAPNFTAHFEKTIDNDTLRFMSQLRAEIKAIVNLPNNKKIYNDVSDFEARKSSDKSVNRIQHFYDAWINESGPFARVQEFAEGKGWDGKDVNTLAQTYRGFEAKALSMLFDKQRDLSGNVIGDSMREILEPISRKEVKKRKGDFLQERKDFISYLISRRAMDYKDRDLVMPQPWYVYEDNIIDMETKYPHFEGVFDGIREWEDNNLQLLVESGIKSQDEVDNIRYMNANHVPLYRIREAAEAIRAGSGNTLGQSKNVIKRAKGSGATIIDPLESMIVDSFIIRRAAEANGINNILYDMAGNVEGFGSMAERVPPGGTKTSFHVDEVKNQLKRIAKANQDTALTDAVDKMKDEELEAVMSIYRPLFRERDNEVTVYVNGSKKLLQVEPELYKAIKGLNREQSNIVIRMLNVPKRILQAGAVTTIDFIMRNMARDTGSSLMQSESGINPLDIAKGYIEALRKGKWQKEMTAYGGASEFLMVNERAEAQRLEDDLLGLNLGEKWRRFVNSIQEAKQNNNERTRNKAINSFKQFAGSPINLIREGIKFSEEGPRVAEFKKAVQKGVDKDTAALWARQLSVDFQRHGYTAKEVNKITAFFNAGIQGNVRILETFKKHPLRTLARGFLYVTLPSMLLYFFNHDDEDYKQLAEWKKALYYNIPIGGGKFISIPKPYGYGFIFGSLPEIMMDKILRDDPETWKRIAESFALHFSIPFVPAAIKPAIDIYANISWTGAPIENQADQKNRTAYLVRDDKTSLLSALIGDVLQNEKGISPKQIDYLIKQHTGKVGEFLWKLPDAIKTGVEIPTDITQYPLIKSFITDSAHSSDAVNKLYDLGEELGSRYEALKDTGKYKAMEHMPIEQQKKLFESLEMARTEYNSIAKEFTEARKTLKAIKSDDSLSPAVKNGKERAINFKMNQMAKAFNDKYLKFKQKYGIK